MVLVMLDFRGTIERDGQMDSLKDIGATVDYKCLWSMYWTVVSN